jgi:hypothetical protein
MLKGYHGPRRSFKPLLERLTINTLLLAAQESHITLPLIENVCEQFEHDTLLLRLLSMFFLKGKPLSFKRLNRFNCINQTYNPKISYNELTAKIILSTQIFSEVKERAISNTNGCCLAHSYYTHTSMPIDTNSLTDHPVRSVPLRTYLLSKATCSCFSLWSHRSETENSPTRRCQIINDALSGMYI